MNPKKQKTIDIDPNKLPAGQIRVKKPTPDVPKHTSPGKALKKGKQSKPIGQHDDTPFMFLCNSCGMKLEAPPSAVGHAVVCPNCENEINVPHPTPIANEEGMYYQKPSVFKFFCIRCGKSLEINRNLSGHRVACPLCHSNIVVPDPPDAAPATSEAP